MDIVNKIKQYIDEIYEKDANSEKDMDFIFNDSLHFIMLVVKIEEELEIIFEDDMLSNVDYNNFDVLCDYVNKLVKKNEEQKN